MGTIIAALIAASVATFGYMITARSKLLEERAKRYAAALSAVHAYQELPYRIRRRPDSCAVTRGTLGTTISDIQLELDFHRRLLELDSPMLGREYFALVQKSRELGKPYRDTAWKEPPATRDERMGFPEEYRYETDDQMKICLAQMRHHLRLVPMPTLWRE
jgi:hypothetical protein